MLCMFPHASVLDIEPLIFGMLCVPMPLVQILSHSTYMLCVPIASVLNIEPFRHAGVPNASVVDIDPFRHAAEPPSVQICPYFFTDSEI